MLSRKNTDYPRIDLSATTLNLPVGMSKKLNFFALDIENAIAKIKIFLKT